MREVHGIFVAIGFKRLGLAIIMIGVICVTAWIDSPHIQFRFAVHDPFGNYFTCTATLRDAEGK